MEKQTVPPLRTSPGAPPAMTGEKGLAAGRRVRLLGEGGALGDRRAPVNADTVHAAAGQRGQEGAVSG